MDLKSLIIDTKTVWVDFPDLEGFSVELTYLSRKELTAIRKRNTHTKFDRRTRTSNEVLDEDKFLKDFVEATIKNWKGLTLKHLSELVLVKTEGLDLKQKVEYTAEHAELLVRESPEFDTWLNEVVFDLDNFRS